MTMQNLERRLVRLEQIHPATRLDFSEVPTDELRDVLTIFDRHGMRSDETVHEANPEALEAAHREVMEDCPHVRVAYEEAIKGG